MQLQDGALAMTTSESHLPLQKVAERGQKLGQVDVATAKMNKEAYRMRHNAEKFQEQEEQQQK